MGNLDTTPGRSHVSELRAIVSDKKQQPIICSIPCEIFAEVPLFPSEVRGGLDKMQLLPLGLRVSVCVHIFVLSLLLGLGTSWILKTKS